MGEMGKSIAGFGIDLQSELSLRSPTAPQLLERCTKPALEALPLQRLHPAFPRPPASANVYHPSPVPPLPVYCLCLSVQNPEPWSPKRPKVGSPTRFSFTLEVPKGHLVLAVAPSKEEASTFLQVCSSAMACGHYSFA